ncbi:PepSY domain-containing protein [Azovibrio restrictus]|uniref:PepSY domain-containing protein n=1 Tax=Azovibrio restrictus TaxID=146938 RepID=UPI0004006BBA|nr:PepSY domain-containing protein [Azovibrio restrictus]MCE1172201.1 PepSY domain-containing protein [Azovibrio sp.]MDD3484319.1 PepSY domain-containing protein [Azovibrio restrictus]
MRKKLSVIVLLLGLVGLQPGPLLADEADHERARKALAAGEIMPLRQVLERVEKDYPGQVLEVELDREHGQWIYEIKLLRPDGAVSKLELDARDGTLLRRRHRHGAAEGRP